MWDKMSALAAVASLLVSVCALWVAVSGARSSLGVATEALTSARQANDIALGRLREPSIVEFAFAQKSGGFDFDFTDPEALSEPLKQIITIHNAGNTNVDSVSIEVIGIEPLTYLLLDPSLEIRSLPSIDVDIRFRSVLQPDGLAHIDVRKMILEYLVAIGPKLPDRNAVYVSMINVVLAPKSISESAAIGATSTLTGDDRRFLAVKFIPSVIEGDQATQILNSSEVKTRVYAP